MNYEIFDKINAHGIKVEELKLNITDMVPVLYLRVLVDNCIYHLEFTNVSGVNIRDFSLPFQVQGFEIMNNKSRSWDKALTYRIHDYEDQKIDFYCENVTIK